MNMGKKIRGVNLGGWLVLEKWMKPSLFDGLKAVDHTTFCIELGNKASAVLQKHWETFITEDDFKWLAERGINAVRIPVGHWIFGNNYPEHWSYKGIRYPYVQGGLDILDFAVKTAQKNNLLVLLDLHAAPGCQNGFDNGGIKDAVDWHTKKEYIDHSLNVLEWLAERYCSFENLSGIEVLNEPQWGIETQILKDYNEQAYRRIRKWCKAKDVAVVFSDGFRSYKEWQDFMREPEYSNVVYDIHRYQCFLDYQIRMDIYGHIQEAAIHWKNETDEINKNLNLWTYVGEWSLGLDIKTVSLWAPWPLQSCV